MDLIKKFNIKITGEGEKALLFSHGYGCDQNMWRFVASQFESDYKVILFDHLGCGKSDSSEYSFLRYNSLQAYADDVVAITRGLELEDVSYIGHSVSAMIGVLAQISVPGLFDRLVLIGPSPRYINDEDYVGGFEREDIEGLIEALESNYLGWSHTMAPVIMGNSDRPELSEELENSFCQMDPEIAKNFARLTFYSDNREDLKKVDTDTMILQCSEDVIAPKEVGEFVHRNIKSSHLKIMQATGHCPNLSAPEETTQMIKDYLTEGTS